MGNSTFFYGNEQLELRKQLEEGGGGGGVTPEDLNAVKEEITENYTDADNINRDFTVINHRNSTDLIASNITDIAKCKNFMFPVNVGLLNLDGTADEGCLIPYSRKGKLHQEMTWNGLDGFTFVVETSMGLYALCNYEFDGYYPDRFLDIEYEFVKSEYGMYIIVKAMFKYDDHGVPSFWNKVQFFEYNDSVITNEVLKNGFKYMPNGSSSDDIYLYVYDMEGLEDNSTPFNIIADASSPVGGISTDGYTPTKIKILDKSKLSAFKVLYYRDEPPFVWGSAKDYVNEIKNLNGYDTFLVYCDKKDEHNFHVYIKDYYTGTTLISENINCYSKYVCWSFRTLTNSGEPLNYEGGIKPPVINPK